MEVFYRANCPVCGFTLTAREPRSDDEEFECGCCGSVAAASWTIWEEEDERQPPETPSPDATPPPLPPVQAAPPLPPVQRVEQTTAKSGRSMRYVVLQVVLKEKFLGTGSGNLTELENVINTQTAKGYRLHTITTASSGSKGLLGGDRIQATLVFEELHS